jgi:hypothetical protein
MSPRLSLEQALETDERSLALDILLSDRLAAFIPVAERTNWVDSALALGKKLALEMQARQSSCNVREIVEQNSIIVHVERSARISPVRFVSTYEPHPPTITLYETTLNTLRDTVASEGLAADFVELGNIALAHEFFHYLDHKPSDASTAARFQVTTWQFGPWKRQATIHNAVEIAAHSFAKVFLGLKRFPGILDYFMLQQN